MLTGWWSNHISYLIGYRFGRGCFFLVKASCSCCHRHMVSSLFWLRLMRNGCLGILLSQTHISSDFSGVSVVNFHSSLLCVEKEALVSALTPSYSIQLLSVNYGDVTGLQQILTPSLWRQLCCYALSTDQTGFQCSWDTLPPSVCKSCMSR